MTVVFYLNLKNCVNQRGCSFSYSSTSVYYNYDLYVNYLVHVNSSTWFNINFYVIADLSTVIVSSNLPSANLIKRNSDALHKAPIVNTGLQMPAERGNKMSRT